MTYELAKQLNDAGFPQSNEWLDNDTSFWVDKGELKYEVPTLSELLEACGDYFSLFKRPLGAWNSSKSDGKQVFITTGTTPEETVAKLWLKLNKK